MVIITTVVNIRCDEVGCGEWGSFCADNEEKALVAARTAGWFIALTRGVDCPKCKKRKHGPARI